MAHPFQQFPLDVDREARGLPVLHAGAGDALVKAAAAAARATPCETMEDVEERVRVLGDLKTAFLAAIDEMVGDAHRAIDRVDGLAPWFLTLDRDLNDAWIRDIEDNDPRFSSLSGRLARHYDRRHRGRSGEAA